MSTEDWTDGYADRKFIEALQWEHAFQRAIRRYRSWILIWLGRTRIWLAHRYQNAATYDYLMALIDEAHDHAIMELDNAYTCARCVLAAQMAGRIYDEEKTGRETYHLEIKEDSDDLV